MKIPDHIMEDLRVERDEDIDRVIAKHDAFWSMIERCESPMEQEFLAAVPSVFDITHVVTSPHSGTDAWWNYPRIFLAGAGWTHGIERFSIWLFPQYEIHTQGMYGEKPTTYRADFVFFLMRPEWSSDTIDTRHAAIVVEVDGHDFHERTKEQASRDKKRDRLMARDGYTVLRFTGSDVRRDAVACVCEVDQLLSSRGHEIVSRMGM